MRVKTESLLKMRKLECVENSKTHRKQNILSFFWNVKCSQLFLWGPEKILRFLQFFILIQFWGGAINFPFEYGLLPYACKETCVQKHSLVVKKSSTIWKQTAWQVHHWDRLWILFKNYKNVLPVKMRPIGWLILQVNSFHDVQLCNTQDSRWRHYWKNIYTSRPSQGRFFNFL